MQLPPNIALYRWLILFISCIVAFGNYYCFDIPSVLYTELSEYFADVTYFDVNFNMLYILYSIPNIALPLFGGFLIDVCGHRSMILVFSCTVFVGQFITSMGCAGRNINMMLFGRFVFGIGGESLMVSIVTMLSSWFEGKELAFAMGLLLSLSRVGSAANDWISPIIEVEKGVTLVFWFGSFLCMFSLLSTVFIVATDYICMSPYEEKEQNLYPYSDSDSSDSDHSSPPVCQSSTEYTTYCNTLANSKIGTIPISDDDTFLDTDGRTEQNQNSGTPSVPSKRDIGLEMMPPIPEEGSVSGSEGELTFKDSFNDTDTSPASNTPSSPRGEYITLSDLKRQKRPLWPPSENPRIWYVILCCFCTYGALVPFISISNEVLRVGYFSKLAQIDADAVEFLVSRLQSVPFLLSALLYPFLGIAVDHIGHRTVLIFIAPLFLSLAHMMMSCSAGNPLIPLLLVGLAYSIFASVIWPVVPMLVEYHLQGLAFGVMTCTQNLAQTAIPAVISIVLTENAQHHDHSTSTAHLREGTMLKGVQKCEVLFAALSLLGMVFGGLLWYLDEFPSVGVGGVLRCATKRSIDAMYVDDGDVGHILPALPPRGSCASHTLTGITFSHTQSSTESSSSRSPHTDEDSDKEDEIDRSTWELYSAPSGTETVPLMSSGDHKISYSSISCNTRARSSSMPLDMSAKSCLHTKGGNMKKAVSFAGNSFPERKPGQGQHPPIPVKRRNSLQGVSGHKFRVPHF